MYRQILGYQRRSARSVLSLQMSSCCILQAQTTVLPNGLRQDEFEKTSVNMSTYLVAFVVAEFASVKQNVSGTLVCPTQI